MPGRERNCSYWHRAHQGPALQSAEHPEIQWDESTLSKSRTLLAPTENTPNTVLMENHYSTKCQMHLHHPSWQAKPWTGTGQHCQTWADSFAVILHLFTQQDGLMALCWYLVFKPCHPISKLYLFPIDWQCGTVTCEWNLRGQSEPKQSTCEPWLTPELYFYTFYFFIWLIKQVLHWPLVQPSPLTHHLC